MPASLPTRWRDARDASDAFFRLLRPKAIYDRPVPERHRLVFYLGHLEAFDWNLLAPALDLKPFRPDWDQLFAFGIDPVGGRLPDEPASAWPRARLVTDYNGSIRQALDAAMESVPAEMLALRLEVALEHRLMHIETLSYLLHNLSHARKRPGPPPSPSGPALPPPPSVPIPAGNATLGRPRGHGFGWDNEFDQHQLPVPAFAADARKVSNGDYLAFVNQGAPPPLFWSCGAGGWQYRGMFAYVPLPLDQPVYVTHAEAAAYSAWRGRRLPTEAEWHRMAEGAACSRSPHGGWDPLPLCAHPPSDSRWGMHDLIGSGWEWTSTPFAPFPGFTPFEFYPGYSANFFDGQHFVLKGGSVRTPACLLRPSFRNWFQPHYPYVYASFRCVA